MKDWNSQTKTDIKCSYHLQYLQNIHFSFFAQQVIVATWDKSASEKNHWCKKVYFPVGQAAMLELTEVASVVNSLYSNQA